MSKQSAPDDAPDAVPRLRTRALTNHRALGSEEFQGYGNSRKSVGGWLGASAAAFRPELRKDKEIDRFTVSVKR
ncbi:hypothetical protein LB553_11205 [Mesorhizobium sp. CA8]|uniref:hypothetical protein n=1 Tax=Mesorhizobium sp. CA8 TaxID=2876637 RepID=UPI001CCD1E4C|nr:hypothetical protein [Mesorhizobium sp. CA8]MBZ9761439.1 hypothetical protein [Mesorhizobium sp. CA8]